MEDLGDLLYILFAIVGVVFSILKKNNKKARKVTPPIDAGDEFSDSDEDEIPGFGNIFGEQPKAEPPKPVTAQETVEKKTPDPSMEEKKRQLENISRIKKTKPMVVEEEEVDEEKLEQDFNLRQAVIYSEILKRPQF